MAKKIVRYLLQGKGISPDFIEKGGFLINENEELVGLTVDADKRYIPDSVKILTKQDLIDRATLLITNDRKGGTIDSSYILRYVNSLLAQLGVPDYE